MSEGILDELLWPWQSSLKLELVAETCEISGLPVRSTSWECMSDTDAASTEAVSVVWATDSSVGAGVNGQVIRIRRFSLEQRCSSAADQRPRFQSHAVLNRIPVPRRYLEP